MFLVAEILNHLNLDFKDVFKVHLWWCVQVQPSSTVTSQRQLRWIRTGNIWSLCLWVLLKGKASTQTHIIHMCHGQNIPISWVSWPFYKNRLMSIFQSLLVFYVFFLDHLPSGYQKWLAGKSIRASSFGATACAWHAPRRSWTNQHRCGTLVFFLHLFKEGAIYSIYYPTYKGPTMNVLFD